MKSKSIFFLLLCFYLQATEILITPIPQHLAYNKEKANIGKMLFFDSALSRDKSISCSSCHKPSHAYSDKLDKSIGIFGQKDIVQTPTILNSTFNFKQFWDGKADNLKQQVNITLHNKIEMGMNKRSIVEAVDKNIFYKNSFYKIYNTHKITYEMIVDSLAEFQKSLITPNSKFDRYLKNRTKLTKKEQNGYRLFKKLGCITCHNGINIGGNSFQKIGIIFKYKNCSNDRYGITHNEIDRCVYKIPTLRNIALTSPYFHNASAKTLEKAIETMSYYNLGYRLDKDSVIDIKSFLETLTGKIPNIGTK